MCPDMRAVPDEIKILIVEDEIPVAMTIMVLLAANCEIKVAMTGAKAIRMAEIEIFDLITLDVDLPDINGFEVCRHLKENPFFQTPIVFVSGGSLEQDIQRGLELGAVDYITKPFSAELVHRLLSHIKREKDLIET
jgi:putative two-component system response regulator